jgi:hypothetical protein
MLAILKRMETDHPYESPIFCEGGPFADPKSFLLCMLDRRQPPAVSVIGRLRNWNEGLTPAGNCSFGDPNIWSLIIFVSRQEVNMTVNVTLKYSRGYCSHFTKSRT